MTHPNKALLPAGFHDLLAGEAIFSEWIAARLTECFESYGYSYVNPPLMEFETSLLSGQGKALTSQTFRLMDPHSHQMMGVRPDITMQIVRIATTRLKNEPLPIRLSYAGPVLRVKGTYLYGERQLMQAGIELIGAGNAVSANAEVIIAALDALTRLGVPDLSVDFNLPGLASILLQHADIEEEHKHHLQQALNKKDTAQVATLAGDSAPLLLDLLNPSGNSAKTLALFTRPEIPTAARELADNLAKVLEMIKEAHPSVGLTIDPLEYRGFEYHTGIGFSIFSRNSAAELGRGGRYTVEGPAVKDEAVGVTLDINTLLRILPIPARKTHIYLPAGTAYLQAHALRAQGAVTLQGLEPVADPKAEATRLKCDAVYLDGKVVTLS